jgi:transposase
VSKRPRLPEHLPVVEEVLDPLEVQAAPQDWKLIGAEVSEQLDYQPGRFFRRRLIRRKYVSKLDRALPPLIAPLPPVLQERCLAAPGLIAHIITGKYCDHLPLYRQQQIYRRQHGVELSRQTMDQWVLLAADWLRPVYEQIRQEALAGDYLQVDETPVRYLDPGGGQCGTGYLWTINRPGHGVCYQWHDSRAAACLPKIIPAQFAGILQCDGYAAYPSYNRQRATPLTLAACWAHSRRKFCAAAQNGGRDAALIMRLIGQLYAVEQGLRHQRAGANLRHAVRAWQSQPLLNRIKNILSHWQRQCRHLPQTNMGKAIDYTLNLWEELTVYVRHGQVEIDNNLIENAIRPTALGKKNWLFFGHAKAGQHSAILYTIIENCRRLGLDPETYLRDVLTKLPRATNHQVHTLTPAALAKHLHPAQSRQAA